MKRFIFTKNGKLVITLNRFIERKNDFIFYDSNNIFVLKIDKLKNSLKNHFIILKNGETFIDMDQIVYRNDKIVCYNEADHKKMLTIKICNTDNDTDILLNLNTVK